MIREKALIIFREILRWENNQKMKTKLFRILMIILCICTLFTIYGFSNQNGIQSKGISTKISKCILNFSSQYREMDTKEKTRILNRTNAIIRKVAHFSIYTLLGIFLMGMMTKTKVKDRWRILITIGLGMLYAILDEFHQSFSPGRTPKITDVYIDTLGIIIGILLVIFARKIYRNIILKYYER